MGYPCVLDFAMLHTAAVAVEMKLGNMRREIFFRVEQAEKKTVFNFVSTFTVPKCVTHFLFCVTMMCGNDLIFDLFRLLFFYFFPLFLRQFFIWLTETDALPTPSFQFAEQEGRNKNQIINAVRDKQSYSFYTK